MKKILIFTIIVIFLICCNTSPEENNNSSSSNSGDNQQTSSTSSNTGIKFNFQFKCGTDIPFGGSSGQKVYAIWIQNENENFIQTIFICQNIMSMSHRIMTPYWINYVKDGSDQDEIDSVTAATHNNAGDKNIDFTISDLVLKDQNIKKFKVYFEIARSWDGNDWFVYSPEDQPAVLYCTEVDLNTNQTEYVLTPIGWTPNSTNEAAAGIVINNWTLNTFNNEMKYITHHRNAVDNTFGTEDTDNAATKMVSQIKIIIK